MERLPRGRHGLSRDYVVRHQRERLIAGLVRALAEKGYDGTTVSLVGKHAAVSKSDFYRHFASKDECFVAAYKETVEQVQGKVEAACAGEASDSTPHTDAPDGETGRGWAESVYAGLDSLLAYFAAEPARAQMIWVEGLRAGREVCTRFQDAVQGYAPMLGRGAPPVAAAGSLAARADLAGGQGVAAVSTEVIDEAVVGGVASLVGRQVLAGRATQLTDLLPDIAEFALAPYLGVAEARRIISEQ